MKVSITIDFDDYAREAIANNTGKDKKATWAEIKLFMELAVNGRLEDTCFDYDNSKSSDGGSDSE